MVIPTYITWVSGTVVTAAALNSQIRDAGNFFLSKPYCNVWCSSTASIATSTQQLVSWDNEIEDTDTMHSTVINPSRIIFNTLGLYSLTEGTSWATNATGGRYSQVRLNSAGASGSGSGIQAFISAPNSTTSGSGLPTCFKHYRAVNIGDYIEWFVQQSSGAGLALAGGTFFYASALWEMA